jgi:hypothetical protein
LPLPPMIRYTLLFFLFGVSLWQSSADCLAGNDNPAIGARAAGLSNASVTLSDVWALSNNVAGIAKLDRPELGAFAENRFMIRGFNTVAFQAMYPTAKYGVGGIDLYRFGDQLYNEQRFGIGYAHRIGTVSLGIKLDLLQLRIQDLGSRKAVAFSVGAQMEVVPDLVVGAHVYNLNQTRLAEAEDERVPTLMKTGLSYRPSKKLMLNVETEKQLALPADFKAGLEYRIIEKFALRSGFSTLAQSATFGAGFQARAFAVDYALGARTALGVSNHLSVAYRFESR